MKISDYTETISVTGYTPMDVSGTAKKININKIAPDIANNLTTTTAGKVLDATQGKALNDRITANASDIAQMDVDVHSYKLFKSKPWVLYDERSVNSSDLSYPSSAKEVMIVAKENTLGILYSSFFVPAMITSESYLVLGGYYQGTTWDSANCAFIYVTINPTTYKVKNVGGCLKDSGLSVANYNLSTSSAISTQVWYR